MEDPITKELERYYNLKTQCYYRMSERVNSNTVAVEVNDDTVTVDGLARPEADEGQAGHFSAGAA